MNIINLCITVVLLSMASVSAQAQTVESSNQAVQPDNHFSGVYEVVDSLGNVQEQTIKIFYKEGNYYFKAEGATAYKTSLSKDGKILSIKSEESLTTHPDGSIEANLEAYIRIFYEGDQLIYEMTVPDLGTDSYFLQKI